MRLPRFRLRTLMVAVAGVALAIGAEVLRRRREVFLVKVELYSQEEAVYRQSIEVFSRRPLPVSSLKTTMWMIPDPDVDRKRAEFLAGLRLKYERAARHPWLSVAPDPTPPE